VTARVGTAKAPELLHDAREPYINMNELVAVQFQHAETAKPVGVIVQWNCHPETLGGKNTEISADFVGAVVETVAAKYRCPVVYLTGTVGGLMTSLKVPVQDEQGQELADGTIAKTIRYGQQVGALTEKRCKTPKPVPLTPITVRSREIFLPLQNKMYLLARQLGVLDRQAFLWTGDPYWAEPTDDRGWEKSLCLRTEVAWLRLGSLEVAVIPGEIYPELVLGKVRRPIRRDFPEAPAAIYA